MHTAHHRRVHIKSLIRLFILTLNLKCAVVPDWNQRPVLARAVWRTARDARFDGGEQRASGDAVSRELVDNAPVGREVPELIAALAPCRTHKRIVPGVGRTKQTK
jgi:hypothetical protein